MKQVLERSKRVAAQILLLKHARQCTDPSCTVAGCLSTRSGLSRILGNQAAGELTKEQQIAFTKVKKLLLHERECLAKRRKLNPRAPSFCLVCALVQHGEPTSRQEDKVSARRTREISEFLGSPRVGGRQLGANSDVTVQESVTASA